MVPPGAPMLIQTSPRANTANATHRAPARSRLLLFDDGRRADASQQGRPAAPVPAAALPAGAGAGAAACARACRPAWAGRGRSALVVLKAQDALGEGGGVDLPLWADDLLELVDAGEGAEALREVVGREALVELGGGGTPLGGEGHKHLREVVGREALVELGGGRGVHHQEGRGRSTCARSSGARLSWS